MRENECINRTHVDSLVTDTEVSPSVEASSTVDSVTVKRPKDLPQTSSTISYRIHGETDWTTADVISNAGKKSTGN